MIYTKKNTKDENGATAGKKDFLRLQTKVKNISLRSW